MRSGFIFAILLLFIQTVASAFFGGGGATAEIPAAKFLEPTSCGSCVYSGIQKAISKETK